METFVKDLASALPPNDTLKWYISNLKSNNEFHTLNIYHFMLKDCDSAGDLCEITGRNKVLNNCSNYVFVKFWGFLNNHGKSDYLLGCQKCDKDINALANIQRAKETFEDNFIQQRKLEYCIHNQAVEFFKPGDIFKIESFAGPWVHFEDVPDIQEIKKTGRPWMCAVWSAGNYGLLYKNRISGHTIRCVKCKDSKICSHVSMYKSNLEEENTGEHEEDEEQMEAGQQVEADPQDEHREQVEVRAQPSVTTASTTKIDFSKKKGFIIKKTSQKYSPHPPIQWPLNDELHAKFIYLAEEGFQYKDKIHQVPDSVGKCPNGFSWDESCPIKQGLVYS